MTGAELVLRIAAARGITACFANPGTTEMALVNAFDAVPAIRPVLGLFEGVCTGMADGYARMAGKPALTLLHLGVGLANGGANLHNARRAHSAIVNLVGDHPQSHLPYDAPLTSDIATLAKPFSNWVHTARIAETLADNVNEAITQAGMCPGKIATLILPADIMEGPARAGEDAPRSAEPDTPRATLDMIALERVVHAVRNEGRIGILLGGDALLEPALLLAGRIAAGAKVNLFAEPFPGRMDRGAGLPEVTRLPYFPEDVLKRLDGLSHLVLVGAKPPVSFFQYPGYPNLLVPEGCEIIKLSAPESPSVPALDALLHFLSIQSAEPKLVKLERPEPPTGPITTRSLAAAIAATLPEHAIIADESATSGGPAYHLTRTAPRHSAMYLTGGGIGFGLPAATGAAVACPDRRVLALQGDGGGMYTLQALWTQARERLDVTNIILVNRRYQILQTEFLRATKDTPMGPTAESLTDLHRPEIDWCALSLGMGIPAARPTSAEALTKALQRSFKEPGPSLIEVVL
jgi:acetolactate synthase-1/2/3 large subunit